jgi:ribosomal protein S18 acetylase RimI-like enzyme
MSATVRRGVEVQALVGEPVLVPATLTAVLVGNLAEQASSTRRASRSLSTCRRIAVRRCMSSKRRTPLKASRRTRNVGRSPMIPTAARPAGGLTAAAIRPARAADLPTLGEFFAGLSRQARYLRFFAPTTPSPALLDLLCGGAGTSDALLATRGGVIIGHGMAADRSGPGGTRTTDIGVVVADAWQRQGVGSALMRALITGAEAQGVTSVTMDVLHGNYPALAMIKSRWPAARTRRSRDFDTICVQLPHS